MQVGLRVSSEGDWDEICSSTEWSLQEGVPRAGKPAEAFVTVIEVAVTHSEWEEGVLNQELTGQQRSGQSCGCVTCPAGLACH